MSDLETLYNSFSDDFKDIYGIRPWFAMTEEEILKWYDLHIDWHEHQDEYAAWIDSGDHNKKQKGNYNEKNLFNLFTSFAAFFSC